jgi:hypothetical protein
VLSAAALGLALAATGCTYFSPVQTHDFYQAGDGTNANLEVNGQFHAGVRNAVLVMGETGDPVLSATVVNYSSEDIVVELEAEHDGATLFSTRVQVPAESTVELGPEEGQQLVPVGPVDVLPGTILDLTVTSEDLSTTISLPTLETTLSHYGEATPAAG